MESSWMVQADQCWFTALQKSKIMFKQFNCQVGELLKEKTHQVKLSPLDTENPSFHWTGTKPLTVGQFFFFPNGGDIVCTHEANCLRHSYFAVVTKTVVGHTNRFWRYLQTQRPASWVSSIGKKTVIHRMSVDQKYVWVWRHIIQRRYFESCGNRYLGSRVKVHYGTRWAALWLYISIRCRWTSLMWAESTKLYKVTASNKCKCGQNVAFQFWDFHRFPPCCAVKQLPFGMARRRVCLRLCRVSDGCSEVWLWQCWRCLPSPGAEVQDPGREFSGKFSPNENFNENICFLYNLSESFFSYFIFDFAWDSQMWTSRRCRLAANWDEVRGDFPALQQEAQSKTKQFAWFVIFIARLVSVDFSV